MKHRILIPLFLLGIVAATAYYARPHTAAAQGPINVVSTRSYQLFPIGSVSGADAPAYNTVNDTLPRFAADSVLVTDSVYVEGARMMQLVAWVRAADGADTVLAPLPQVHGPNSPGQWASGTTFIGIANGPDAGAGVTAMTPNEQVVWSWVAELGTSGTPMPIPGRWWRWRVKSNDARRYSAAAGATLAATGRVNFTLRVWRF